MDKNKQLFVFNTPCKDLIKQIDKYPIHFFAADINYTAVLVNDLQAEHFGVSSVSSFIGKNYYHDVLNNKKEKDIIKFNNANVINSDRPQLVCEICFNKPCLCVKTKLMDSANNVLGVGGLAFYLHQMPFEKIIPWINKFIHPDASGYNFYYRYISRAPQFNQLSKREQECVHYLTKSMSYKEMAAAMEISVRTVETYIDRIKNKLGSYNRSDIVSKVFEFNG